MFNASSSSHLTSQTFGPWLILSALKDLCMAALTFCFDTLRTGGHFVCKYYQGAEEKDLELRLKKLFEKVHREKPESSRNVCIPTPRYTLAILNYIYKTTDMMTIGVEGSILRRPPQKRNSDARRSPRLVD
jgi:hypothetical protein